jgi:ribonuclease P protein component
MVAYPTAVSITSGNSLIDVVGPVVLPHRRHVFVRSKEKAAVPDNEFMPATPIRDEDPPAAADYRLRKHAEYQRVYREGRKQFSSSMSYFFAIRSKGSPSPAGPRVGLTAGKVLGNAVERNRIKRRMRDIVRRRVSFVHADVDIVLHPRKSVLTIDFAKLESEVVRIFTTIDDAVRKTTATTPVHPKVEL